MNASASQYIEQELVISKATSHPDNSSYTYLPGHKLQLSSGEVVCNTITTDFLGFGEEATSTGAISRVMGNYYCGTSNSLYQLQESLSHFLQTEDTLVLGSYEGLCADIMESLLNTEDAVIYDSAISVPMRRGIKSCQAEKMRYPHGDMEKLEQNLQLTMLKRLRVIVTDGIFYDSGQCANLQAIRQLASQYDALVIIDDSFGFLTAGKNGRGADELCGVKGFQDLKIVNMQHALGCNTGVFASGDKNLIQLLRLRSRCCRHTLTPSENDIANAKKVIDTISADTSRIALMHQKAQQLCEILRNAGYDCEKPAAGIVSFVTDASADKTKDALRQLGLVGQYSKVGRQTLVSIKVSTLCDF